MSLIGPYGATEADYRRERITASFRDHRTAAARGCVAPRGVGRDAA